MSRPRAMPLDARWPEVDLLPPDLSPWRRGNAGVPGFITLRSLLPGPHLGLVSLIHGNEFAGAIALDGLLRSGLSPTRGTLTIGFANLAAFDRFDPAQPTAARFIHEDLNRIWDPVRLSSLPVQGGNTAENRRAREILPLLRNFDVLLDLHSMLWPSDPVFLASGEDSSSPHDAAAFAGRLGVDCMIVTDPGHSAGLRMIDHPHFAGPAIACLFEAGPHWHRSTVQLCEDAALGALAALDMLAPEIAARHARPARKAEPRRARVVATITARGRAFTFRHPYRGGTIIPRAGTLIACDGATEIRTPCDSCLLVMPTPRPRPGHTAVRLAQLLPEPSAT